MILYLDTSDLLKLYLEEEGSERVEAAVARASQLTTSLITYAEARAALAKARRLGSMPDGSYSQTVATFESQWDSVSRVDVSEDIVRTAGELAERNDLRGYDAVHLASALLVQKESRSRVLFSTSDRDLRAAADNEGLRAPS